MKSLLFIYSFFFLESIGFAQKFDWVKFYQGNSVQQLVSVSTDKNGNVYHSINFVEEIKKDTLKVLGSNTYWRSFIGKLDSSGKMLWYKVVKSASNQNATTLSSTFNNAGNIIVFIACQTDLIVDKDTIKKLGGSGVATYIVEFNKTGQLVRGKQLIEGSLATINYISKNFCNDSKDNLYLSLRISGSIKVYDTTGTINLGSASGNYILKLSNSGRKLEWSKILPNSIITNNIDVDIRGNVYLSCYWNTSPNSFTFKSQTLNRPQNNTGAVFIFDKNGNDKNWFNILSSSGESTVHGVVAYDTNSLFVTGYFKGDSAKFGSKWKKVKTIGAYHFVSKYDIKGNNIWVRTEDTAFSSSYNNHDDYGSITKFANEYVYVSYLTYAQYGRVVIDGISYYANGLKWGMNLKVDALGNTLWGFRTFYPFSAMQTDQYSNMYFGSWFETDSVFYGSFKAKGDQGDALIGKTYDYAIFRGFVKNGPYCAGDSIKIPYKKLGEFSKTNVFYAELSNEFGEFNGTERILGSDSSDVDGIIVGKLPLFKVSSSGKYRIRIRSTSPQAQSYYKLDTLNLLVYSKDKADPGPPEKICLGDSIKLKTFGGTKWSWRPKFRMNDSTGQSPIVWPNVSTDYTIIISDSSGCGLADTAIKKIIVRKEPKIQFITQKDTIVCLGSTVPVIASFLYGDSLGYEWDWLSVNKFGVQNYLKSGKGKIRDTIQFKMPSNERDSIKLLLLLRDGCSPGNYFSFYTIKVNKSLPEINLSSSDTVGCPGKRIEIETSFRSGNVSSFNWQWFDKNSFGQWKLLYKKNGNNKDTLSYLLPSNFTQKDIRIILNDNCSIYNDTAQIKILPRKKLDLNLTTKDTFICKGKSVLLKAKGSGGLSSSYKYEWLDIDKNIIVSNNDSLFVKPDTIMNFSVSLTDKCMPDTVQNSVQVKLHPSISSSILDITRKIANDTTICYGQSLKFFAKYSGGKGSSYKMEWYLDSTLMSSFDSLIVQLQNQNSDSNILRKLCLTINDNCTELGDTSIIYISRLAALKVGISAIDTLCFGTSAVFKANCIGGNGTYKFKWWENSGTKGVADTVLIAHLNPLKIGVDSIYTEIKDDCSISDTVQTNYTFLAPLNLSLNLVDTCTNNYISISPNKTGGKLSQTKVSIWEDNVFKGDFKDSIKLYPKGQLSKYKLVASHEVCK